MEQIFGGSPLGVMIRLIVISIIVGVVMAALGLRPEDLFDVVRNFVHWLYDLGFDSIEKIFRYFLVGAVIVFPIWIIYRLLKLLSDSGKPGSQ